MCTKHLYIWVERIRQTSAPPLPLGGHEKWKWARAVGHAEERTHKLMSQYEQNFVFVIDCFPATMKLQDLYVHLGQ